MPKAVEKTAKIGVLGASGYTGAELLRLLIRHPGIEIALLTAERRAGQHMRQVFPQFSPYALPKLLAIDAVDWKAQALDLAFCALPHATTQTVIKDLLAAAPTTKVVDLSADFRLADTAAYARWYGHEHHAPELQKEAVYGLTEIYREKIKAARLVANPEEMEQWLQPMVDAGVDILHCSQRRFWEPEFPEIDGEQGLNFAG